MERISSCNFTFKQHALKEAIFHEDHVTFCMRDGKSHTFKYNDCTAVESILANYGKVVLEISSKNPAKSKTIGIGYPEELSEQEINEIKIRLNCTQGIC
jgi:uncharacterized protein (UPF0216 family)